jgi:hypothetical protein
MTDPRHNAGSVPAIPSAFLSVTDAVAKVVNKLFPAKARELRPTADEQLALLTYLDARRARAILTRGDRDSAANADIKERLDRQAQMTDEIRLLLKRGQARIDLDTAGWKELLQLLGSGTLRSCVLTSEGEMAPLPAHIWLQPDAANVWLTDEIYFAVNDVISYRGRPLIRAEELHNVLTPKATNVAGGAIDGSAQSDVSQDPVGERRGRKKEYDWPAIIMEAARIVFYDGVPRSQNELIDRVLTWYNNAYGEMPSATSTKPHISKFWKHLRFDEKSR